MKTICSLLTTLVVVLVLSACSQAQVTPAQVVPTFAPVDFSTPVPVATPEPIVTPTLSAQDTAIEAEWLVQKPKIEVAVASVFNGLTSPWLTPMLDINITTPTPDSPAAHCQAMEVWSNYIPLPDSVAGCRAGHDPLDDFFGNATIPLERTGSDNLVMMIYPYMPIPYCDGVNPCGLLPGPGGAYYGMTIGRYKIVKYCGKVDSKVMNGMRSEPSPYLKDPVSMILLSLDGTGYIQIVANRGAWFSYGWVFDRSKGWSESFQFCPTYGPQ
jgi:hypothetical protein